MEFYVAVTVVSVVAFTVDMVLRYMEKIRSFGMEEHLHNIKGKNIPIEDLIPYNITMLTVYGIAFGVCGISMKFLGLHPFISFPVSLAFGCSVNFVVMHFIKPFFIGISSPNAAYKVACLIEKGYIEKIQSEKDRREYHLHVTDKYLDYLNLSQGYVSTVAKRAEEQFTSQRVQELDSILADMSNDLMKEVDIPHIILEK